MRELAVGLLLAKAGLEMHVAGDRSQAVGHRPFDGTPVIRDQQIGTQPPQRSSTLDEGAHEPAPVSPSRHQPHIQISGKTLCSFEIVVERNDGVA